jgi:hypothetical protein
MTPAAWRFHARTCAPEGCVAVDNVYAFAQQDAAQQRRQPHKAR